MRHLFKAGLTPEISTLKTRYVLSLPRYHEHFSTTQKSLQNSELTKSQWTNLKGRYEALSLLSPNLAPDEAAWTAWVNACGQTKVYIGS